MRLCSWNVNGIRAVHKKEKLDWFWDSDLDIVCLQETKAEISQVSEEIISPPGWRSLWSSGERKGYSGVATFVRESVPCEEMAKGFGIERFDNEGRIQITDHEAFVLLNIYFPNGGKGPERVQYKLEFYEAFLQYVQGLVKEGRDVVVCGDVNTAHRAIDLARPKANEGNTGFLPVERAFLDRFISAGWVDTFRAEHPDQKDAYSWWDYRTRARADNIGWRIDYFFINEALEEVLVDAWISAHILGSDHCPVGVELELEFE